MFSSLTKNLVTIFDKISNHSKIAESNIQSIVEEIKIALIEADVNLLVVEEFINSVKSKALGVEVLNSITPAQMMIKIIHEEIVNVLSLPLSQDQSKNIETKYPLSLLFVSLQGSGKTTSCAKIALKFIKQDKRVLLVSLDTYRPAAQKQLEILADSINCQSLEIIDGQNPLEIAKRAVMQKESFDVIIYDSAGRLHVDQEMMSEITQIKSIFKPSEITLLIDSLSGQDAMNVAFDFDKALKIDNIILSRIDADNKGGVALSLTHFIKKPIKFLSTGEKLNCLEEFDAKRIADRILDQGDVIALVKKAQQSIDEDANERITKRIKKGKFDLNDYLIMISSINKMGGIMSILSLLPGINKMQQKVEGSGINDNSLAKQKAIILSMTKKERRDPDLLNASRRQRIASGSGTSVQDITNARIIKNIYRV